MSQEIDMKVNQEGITPFWRKLPFLLTYPFRPAPLIFMICLLVASALAGLVLGPFGLLLKGTLIYFGLRYAFNVLDLFAKGRFEGHSPDHSLWGPEKRPGKFGLVLVLFLALASALGQWVVGSRAAKHEPTQEILIAEYKKNHAEELAQREREREAFYKRIGLESTSPTAPTPASETPPEDPEDKEADRPAASDPALPNLPGGSESAQTVQPEPGPSREDMIEQSMPEPGTALWLKLLPGWYWLTLVLASLLLPAAAIVIALEDRFFRALNPSNALHLIQTMGGAYFVLWLLFLSIAGLRNLSLRWGEDLAPMLRFPLEMGFATYLGIVLFAIMGYALYQYHQELHLDVEVDFDGHRDAGGAEAIAKAGSAYAAMRQAKPMEPWEQKLYALEKEGNWKEAIAELRDRMRYDRFDPDLNTRLHQLYAKQGDASATLTHGQQWLSALCKAGQGKQALAALQKLLALKPDYMVDNADNLYPLAMAALQAHNPALATELVRGFDKRYPQHADLPGVYFIGARILSEQNRQHDKAARLLRGVLQKFPQHPVHAEASTYLKTLERMQIKANSSA
jgi:tetratricopeptide (TPR) repeat protein